MLLLVSLSFLFFIFLLRFSAFRLLIDTFTQISASRRQPPARGDSLHFAPASIEFSQPALYFSAAPIRHRYAAEAEFLSLQRSKEMPQIAGHTTPISCAERYTMR